MMHWRRRIKVFCGPWALIALLSALAAACQTTRKDVSYGLQSLQAGFVPARIAVLPCSLWPNGARYITLPLSNIPDKDAMEMCRAFDQKVLLSFEGQPFMRGLSPKAVDQLLSRGKNKKSVRDIARLWQFSTANCNECQSLPAFYTYSFAGKPNWRQWLQELSQETMYADAVLFPFVVYGYAGTENDRGVVIRKKTAEVALFLIDTNTSDLIWAGHRNGIVTSGQFEKQDVARPPAEIAWTQLYDRLFTPDLWKDFPGRQNVN